MTQVQLLSLLCLTGAAAIVDARTQRIPNRLMMAGLLLAVVVRIGLAVSAVDAPGHRALAEALLDALGSAALGLFGCAILPLVLYRAGALGGGDVKLLAVAGALLALGPGLELTRAALFAAVGFGWLKLALAGRLWASLRTTGALLKRLFGARCPTPLETASLTPLAFGPHVFVAACYLTLSSWTPVNAPPSAGQEPAPNAPQVTGD